jgi:hypothetical protein
MMFRHLERLILDVTMRVAATVVARRVEAYAGR